MGIFKSTRTYYISPTIIGTVVKSVCNQLKEEGYDVISESLISGGADISITKGGLFKAIVGLKTALKVNIFQNDSHSFTAEAGVGIFGQQAIPTAIMLLVTWPVLIPQIWGLIQQSKLDEHVLDLIQEAINNCQKNQNHLHTESVFCPHCGHSVINESRFCNECGQKM